MILYAKALFLIVFITCATVVQAANLLGGDSFSLAGGWTFYIDKKATGPDTAIVLQDGKIIIKSNGIYNPPVTAVQVIKKIDIDIHKKYRLKFTAKAEKAMTMEISYGLQKSPYTPYFITNVDLISGEKNYEERISFKTQEKVDTALCALRLLGGTIGNNTVMFSDISLVEVLPLQLDSVWKGFLNVEPPDSFVSIPSSLKKSNTNNMVKSQDIRLTDDTVDLAAMAPEKFNERNCAILYNEFSSDKAGVMDVGVSADWWLEIYANGQPVFSTMKTGNEVHNYKPDDHILHFPVKIGKNLMAVKVLSGAEGWRFVCGNPGTPLRNLKFEANAQWKAVDTSDVIVREGSALDLSAVSTVFQDGKLPRLVVGQNGKMEAKGQPGRPVRLNGFNFPGHWLLGFYGAVSDTEIERLVNQSRIQGYNLFRFMHVDAMSKSKDLCIDPALLQKVDWLLAKMQQNNIYMHLVMFAYAHFMPDLEQQGRLSTDNKALMYLGDPQIQKQWRYGAETLMNHVNPYTGKAWKDDPTIACIEFYNEQEFGLTRIDKLSTATRNKLSARFQEWLKKQYKTPEKLAKAWNSPGITSFSQAVMPEQGAVSKSSHATGDFLSFCNELARENAAWCESVLRNVGYQGLTSQYNLPCWGGDNLVRFEKSQVALRNNYFHHPGGKSNSTPGFWWGNRCEQLSSIGETSGYWRNSNATRFADRPFFMTEYNHPFWNRYQYESGFLFGSYAALQGHDAIVIHDRRETMLKVDRPADSFCVDNNPVARASAFLSACLYLRRDVKPSPHRVEIEIPVEWGIQSEHAAISSEQDKIGLLCGFSSSFPATPKRPLRIGTLTCPDITITPSGGALIHAADWSTEIQDKADGKFSLDNFIGLMKQKGVLTEANISLPSKGIFQSDTGEIILRAKENLMKVTTSRTEAVALESNKGETLHYLKVIKTDVSALVSVSSVDGRDLTNSKRIVLLYSTEIANTGMELSGDRVTLLKLGKLPILMKTGHLSIILKNANAKNLSLYALALNGLRTEKLSLKVNNNSELEISLDTACLKNGATPFFEIVSE